MDRVSAQPFEWVVRGASLYIEYRIPLWTEILGPFILSYEHDEDKAVLVFLSRLARALIGILILPSVFSGRYY